MLPLPLEPTDDRANPVFRDAASCKKWLAQFQLTNLQLAHSLLLTEINELNRYPLSGLERLNTLELLRDTVRYVQEGYAKKLVAKPLPLSESELIAFLAIVQLWQAMALGYQRCLQTHLTGDKQLARHGALLCQRSLRYSGLAIFEHLRTGYEIDGRLWRQLHSLYAIAEERGLLFEKVPDPQSENSPPNKSQPTCHDTYLTTLLTSYARPAELSRAQLQLLGSWLPQWCGILIVERSYTASKGDAQPLAFDLSDSPHGLQPARIVKAGESMRYLAMVPLSKLIRVKTILLQQGKTPQQVELGELGSNRECIELLTFLHQCWCEDRDMRFVARNQADQRALLYYNPGRIYAQLTGKAYKPPAKSAEHDSAARKQIETFGRVLQDSPDRKAAETGSPLETWHIDNETILGAQLTRAGTSGGQLSRHQLVALRTGDAESYALGVATWVKIMRTGQLRVGVRYLPGKVDPVTLQAAGPDRTTSDKSAPAFLLQAVPALNIPPSLVVTRDWFKPGQVVEVLRPHGEKQNVKMGFSVEHGTDYERVSFTPA